MSVSSATGDLMAEFRSRPTVRAGSLIVTVFGDAILPRGGVVWIGSLIRALDEFGISERLVRTSVFRLVRDELLEVSQMGRRSYYRLSSNGAREFGRATSRIYGDPRISWDGQWCLVFLTELSTTERDTVRKELGWLGFGALTGNVLGHPAADVAALEAAMEQIGVLQKLVVMRSQIAGASGEFGLHKLVQRGWNLFEIDEQYADFIKQFRPVFAAVKRVRKPAEELSFQIRTLLIHEYRRILLRDPLLPAEMLPSGWHGIAAYQLCRNLYQLVYAQADAFMSANFETADGPLPPPAPEFHIRFDGLQ